MSFPVTAWLCSLRGQLLPTLSGTLSSWHDDTHSPTYSQPFLAGSWSTQTAPEGAVLLPALLSAPSAPRSLEHKHVLLMFVRTEDPTCGCGQTIQTRQHILRDCPKYTHHRSLLGTGRNTHFDRLIGTEKGIERLSKFITITKDINKWNTPNPSADPCMMTNSRNTRARRERRGVG